MIALVITIGISIVWVLLACVIYHFDEWSDLEESFAKSFLMLLLFAFVWAMINSMVGG